MPTIRISRNFGNLAALALFAGAPAIADGELDTTGFHSPDGFVPGTTYATPTGFLSMTRPVAAPDGAILYAYSGPPDHELVWQRVTPLSADPPCVDAILGDTVKLRPADAAFDSDGRLVVAGTAEAPATHRTFFAARYLYPSCLPDPEFSGDGVATYGPAISHFAEQVAIQTTSPFPGVFIDKVVVGGITFDNTPPDDDTKNIVIARLREDGDLDTGFGGGDGAVLIDWSANDHSNSLSDLLIDPLDRIVLAGVEGLIGGDTDAVVARLLPEGTYDTSFGAAASGWRRFELYSTGYGDTVDRLLRAANGELYVTGNAVSGDSRRLSLARLDAVTGAILDTAHWPVVNGQDVFWGAALQGDGRLIVAGFDWTEHDPDPQLFTFAWKVPELVLDPTYNDLADLNPYAYVSVDLLGGDDDDATGLTLDASGRPILSGRAMIPGVASRPFVARLTSAYIFADGFEAGNRSAW